MASLLAKVQTLLAADLNNFVDRALQANEPAVFQHHIRELQGMQEQLDGQLAGLSADLEHARQQTEVQQAVVVSLDHQVDELLAAGNHEEALAAQDRLNGARIVAAHATDQLQRLESELVGVREAKGRLDARIVTLRQQEPALDGLVGLARAKDLTAQAARSLDDLAGTGDPDVARVVESIRQRLAEADAQIRQLEARALAQGEAPATIKRQELESQLAARRVRLGLP
jgi:phage shock protein A